MTGMQQFILGIASAVIAAVSGYLLHKRSKVSDAISAQSGAASIDRAGVDQIIQGLNQLLDQAQDTIKEDREVKSLLDARIEKFIVDLDACKAENARLRKKYAANGD